MTDVESTHLALAVIPFHLGGKQSFNFFAITDIRQKMPSFRGNYNFFLWLSMLGRTKGALDVVPCCSA